RGRTSPRIAVISDEAGEEIDVFTSRFAVLHRHTYYLMTSARPAVPGTMQHRETFARIFRRERGRAAWLQRVELEVEGSGVGGVGHVRTKDFSFKVRTFAGQARVFVVAHVVPGPAVEAAFLHARGVVGHKVVAQHVALVG